MAAAAPTHFARRYSATQQRALDKLHHSKGVFGYSTKLEDDEVLLRIFEGIEVGGRGKPPTRKLPGHARIRTAFDAAREGDLVRLRRFVEKDGFDARRRHDDDAGGNTVLHYAAWAGDIDALHYLVHHVRSRHGEEQLRALLNTVDTVCSKSTPLMEACRSSVGIVAERLECIRELLDAGADATAQDASGDTCLHIGVRGGSLPVVRLLLTASSGGDWAKSALMASTSAVNGRLQRPVDIAAARCGLPRADSYDPAEASAALAASAASGAASGAAAARRRVTGDHARVEMLRLLVGLEDKPRLRVVSALLGQRRVAQAARRRTRLAQDLAELKLQVEDVSHRSWTAWATQRSQAMQLRREERDMIRAATTEQLPAHFAQFLQSAEGQAQLAKVGGGASGEKQLRRQHDRERLDEVEAHFLTQNPPCPEWEEYLVAQRQHEQQAQKEAQQVQRQ